MCLPVWLLLLNSLEFTWNRVAPFEYGSSMRLFLYVSQFLEFYVKAPDLLAMLQM